MTLSKLKSKTPKQLVKTLYSWRYDKAYIIDILVGADVDKKEVLEKMTFEEICAKYKEDVIDCLVDEWSSF